MSRKRPARTGNPDLRQQKHVLAPPIAEIEQEIFSLLSRGNFKPLKLFEEEYRIQNSEFSNLDATLVTLDDSLAAGANINFL
ncbi:hypothetical protein FACHB389_28205 [Nostoc calcicola FACHB-389]|nr:hypothetical protein FACHB389_28205 [Nostoc calcicola FACHB-389]